MLPKFKRCRHTLSQASWLLARLFCLATLAGQAQAQTSLPSPQSQLPRQGQLQAAPSQPHIQSHPGQTSSPQEQAPLKTEESPQASSAAQATPPNSPETILFEDKYRTSVWSVGLNGTWHNLRASDGSRLHGPSAIFEVGRGYMHEKWFVNLSLNVITGPYETPRQQDVTIDFSGTGASLQWGYSAANDNLRSKKGNYGFGVGMVYADIVGRSIGERRSRFEENGRVEIIDQFKMNVQYLSLVPSFFYAWLADPRLRSNRPESLMTRIEGYMLNVGVIFPLYASYDISYLRASSKPGEQLIESQEKSHGALRGYSLILSLQTFFGV